MNFAKSEENFLVKSEEIFLVKSEEIFLVKSEEKYLVLHVNKSTRSLHSFSKNTISLSSLMVK